MADLNEIIAEYKALQRDLATAESGKHYFADEAIDEENAIGSGYEYGTEQFWAAKLCSAKMAAGFRAEEAGLDINELIGRAIY